MSQAPSNIVQLARLRRLANDQAHLQAAPKPKILFVDDEERILNSLKALFRLHYDVTVSTDGYHALELLKREHFHLLVSDQRMPIMQGVDLLRQAKTISPQTVRILLTGFSDLAAIVGSVNEGEVYRFINKPWDNDELQDIIASAVKIGVDLAALPKPAIKPLDIEEPIIAQRFEEKPSAKLITIPPTAATSLSATDHFPANEPHLDHHYHYAEPTWSPDTRVLFLDHDQELYHCFQASELTSCQSLSARTAEEALQLMQHYEVHVLVASIDGMDRANLGLLCLLKKEHPHIVLLAVARLGDADTVIGLVNSARVFRVIFHPLRPKVFRPHLEAALKQVKQVQMQPELLRVQQAKAVEPNSSFMAGLGSAIKSKLSSIKSLFGRKRS
ncbi:MAG: hypothetical protein RLZZ422_1744 [Pseudomonadota bacterium]|jgi:serine/threonine-protein kinase